MRFPLFMMLVAGTLAFGGVGCSSSKEEANTKPTEKQSIVSTVELAQAVQGNIEREIDITGHLQAVEKAEIFSRLSGRVVNVFVRAGDKVVKGEPLIGLDDSTLKASEKAAAASVIAARANLQQAQAGLSAARARATQARESMGLTDSSTSIEVQRVRQSVFQAEAATASAQANYDDAVHNMKRQRSLFAKDAVSKYSVEQAELREQTTREQLSAARSAEKAAHKAVNIAEANMRQVSISAGDVKAADAAVEQAVASVEQAKATLEQATAAHESVAIDLRDTILRSPCTGTITMRKVEPGQSVSGNSSNALMSVVNNDVLEMIAPVEETYRATITPGTKLQVKTTLAKGALAKVIDVIPASDPTSHSITVRLQINNPQGVLVEGAYATASLPVENVSGVLIPRTAVNRNQKEVFAVLFDNGVAKKLPLTIVCTNAKDAIVKGLTVGQQVVSSGGLDIVEGQQLQEAEEGK